jgi:LysM domain
VPIYIVNAGDTLSSIAQRHGFASSQQLYDHPSNAALRAKRPHPNLIFPGDQINIPTAGPTGAGLPRDRSQTPFKMAIIDGTGPSADSKYKQEMQHSFCKQLKTGLGLDVAKYRRGPSWLGEQVRAEAVVAYQFLKESHASNPATRLMLAGYSRGGSAAIMAAELLEKDGLKVDSLFLFDAVARHRFLFPAGEVIPANVQFSRHARRDLNALLVLKYEGSFSEVPGINASNPMRPTFGNTGLQWRGSGDHQLAKPFQGSHGALGGVGWHFVAEDPACQVKVADWMNDQLEQRGLGRVLRSFPPQPAAAATTPTVTEAITGLALDALFLARHERNLSRAGEKK